MFGSVSKVSEKIVLDGIRGKGSLNKPVDKSSTIPKKNS